MTKKLARSPRIYDLRSVLRSTKSMKFLDKPGIKTSIVRGPCIGDCGRMVMIERKGKGECRKCRRARVLAGVQRLAKIKRDQRPVRIPRHRRRLEAGLPIKVGPIPRERSW